jgi:hypothetical protein
MIQMWLYSIPHPMAVFLANLISGHLSTKLAGAEAEDEKKHEL